MTARRKWPYGSAECLEWLSKATRQGVHDAWYHLGQAYEDVITFDQYGHSRDIPLSGEQARQLREKAAECYLKGAEADTGLMASWCQYTIAGYYEDGSSILPQNMDLAAYWYQRAFDNRDNRAASKLKDILDPKNTVHIPKCHCILRQTVHRIGLHTARSGNRAERLSQRGKNPTAANSKNSSSQVALR